MDKHSITMIHPDSGAEIEVQPGSVDNARANGWKVVGDSDNWKVEAGKESKPEKLAVKKSAKKK